MEVRDPGGTRIIDTFCNGNPPPFGDPAACTFTRDLAIDTAGFYLVCMSDQNSEEAGTYELALQCVFGDSDCTCADVCVLRTEGAGCSDDNECTDDDTCRRGVCAGAEKCRVIVPDTTPVAPRNPVVPVVVQGEPGARCEATLRPIGVSPRISLPQRAQGADTVYGTATGRIKRNGKVTLKVKLNKYGKQLLGRANGPVQVLADIVIREKKPRRERHLQRILLLQRR